MKINNNKIKSLFLLSLVGSGVGQQASENQTEALVPSATSYPVLPQLSTNFTNAKITQEDPVQNVLVAGSPILITANSYPDNIIYQSKCSSSFLIINTNSSDYCADGNDYGGFLTAYVFCYPSVLEPVNSRLKEVYNWDGLVLGHFPYYWNNNGAEYFYLSANLTNFNLLPFVPKTTDEGITNLLPVISSANPTAPGMTVCVYGAASGYRCGKITEVGTSLTVPNPWGKDEFWTLSNLNKVDLGTNGLLSEDAGAPVYTETQIGERTLAQALGHISKVDNSDPQHQSFYYTPLDKVFSQITADTGCVYSLLTYNENNAQEYDQLLAQIEMPAKK